MDKYVFTFFFGRAIVSVVCGDRSSFQTLGKATEKSRLPKLNF